MTSRAFDALLCDIDGVIRFFDHRELNRLELEAGLQPGTTLRVAFGPERQLPLLLGRLTRDQWAASIARALAADVAESRAGQLAEAFTRAPARADEAVLAMIRQVRGTLPVVLVTNATLWLDDDLALLGLDDLADHVVNSARVGVAKPDPAIYAIAAERAGVPAGRCLFVDDSAANAEAARTAGMSAVHFREASDLRTALAPLLPPARPAPTA
ncbi:HAD-IA family hydrolase [Streptomyces sp. NPDC020917]|uniref:HAD-IA family hydrolase n=1 Tax=Streptomyces sp. NPDC020917 TaxID=3365102 RepID=UPI00378CFEC8